MPDMKKLLLFSMFNIALAFAQAPSAKDNTQAPQPLTVEQILDNYVAARGGRQRILQLRTIVKRGTIETDKKRMTFVKSRRAPDNFVEVETDSNGTKTMLGYDGHTLWGLPSKPVEQKPGMVALVDDRIYKGLPIVTEFGIFPYKKAKLHGVKKVNDRTAHVVEFNLEDGTRTTYYLDTESFLLLRSDSEARVPALLAGLSGMGAGEQGPDRRVLVTSVAYYSDWRDVAGFKVPFEIRGQTSITKIIEYEIDSNIDDVVFVPPPGSMKFPAPGKSPSK